MPSGLPLDQAWPASVDEPLLNDHRAGLVPGHRAGVRTDPVPGFRVLYALASPFRLDHVCTVRRMDNVVRVAVENDGANAWGRLPATQVKDLLRN